jgi:glycosyltransferase involved in cell wall biosynthesis
VSRVLVLCTARGIPIDGPSGASAHLRGVARALADVGHTVRVAAPLRHDARGEHDRLELPVTTLAPRRWPRWLREQGETRDSRALAQAASAFHPDWIWERHTLLGDGGLRLAAALGVPRIVELNAPLALERPGIRWRRRARRIERADLIAADRVIAVSSWLADWARTLGVAPDAIRHVPNGTALVRAGDRAGTRRRLGLTGLVLGFVGTHKPWHGLVRLPAILDAVPEATALVVGGGPTPVPVHPRIHAIGWSPPESLADLVAAMDVGLVPYPADAPPWFCPLKVFDYWAQGVPVVGADHGDLRSLADVVAGHDPNSWARAIREAAGLPRQRRIRSWTQVVDEATHGWPT